VNDEKAEERKSNADDLKYPNLSTLRHSVQPSLRLR
jgi:hypothetical protein